MSSALTALVGAGRGFLSARKLRKEEREEKERRRLQEEELAIRREQLAATRADNEMMNQLRHQQLQQGNQELELKRRQFASEQMPLASDFPTQSLSQLEPTLDLSATAKTFPLELGGTRMNIPATQGAMKAVSPIIQNREDIRAGKYRDTPREPRAPQMSPEDEIKLRVLQGAPIKAGAAGMRPGEQEEAERRYWMGAMKAFPNINFGADTTSNATKALDALRNSDTQDAAINAYNNLKRMAARDPQAKAYFDSIDPKQFSENVKKLPK